MYSDNKLNIIGASVIIRGLKEDMPGTLAVVLWPARHVSTLLQHHASHFYSGWPQETTTNRNSNSNSSVNKI